MFVLSPLSSAVISELYSHCVCNVSRGVYTAAAIA